MIGTLGPPAYDCNLFGIIPTLTEIGGNILFGGFGEKLFVKKQFIRIFRQIRLIHI